MILVRARSHAACRSTASCQQGGYALVVVLWIVMLLSVMTMSYHAMAGVELRSITLLVYQSQARAAAEAAAWHAVLEAHLSEEGLPSGRAPLERELEFDGISVSVTISDISGRINLNHAPPDLLEVILASPSPDASGNTALVEAILDRRDDGRTRPGGGESFMAVDGDVIPILRNSPFATVDELWQVPGMDRDLYGRVAPMLTVLGTHRRININTADRRTLAVLPGATPDWIETALDERKREGTVSRRIAASVDGRFFENTGGDIFSVSATATIGGATAVVSPIVRKPRRGRGPLSIVAWDDETI